MNNDRGHLHTTRKRPESSLSCFPTFNLTWNRLMWVGQRQYRNRQHPAGLLYLARLSWSTSLEFLDFLHRGHDVDTICVQMLWVAKRIAVDVYCGIWCCAQYDWINVTDVAVDIDCVCIQSLHVESWLKQMCTDVIVVSSWPGGLYVDCLYFSCFVMCFSWRMVSTKGMELFLQTVYCQLIH